jgi:hypothetical protein
MKVGACGICCETCGLYTKKICTGCEKTQKQVGFLKNINANCSVLECAVKNKIDVCSKDCNKFPCKKFKNWPLADEWLEMFEGRLKTKR